MKPTQDAMELKSALSQFHGTDGYHRWSVIFPSWVLTDGAKFLAEKAGCFWLMDCIASHIRPGFEDVFAVARLVREETDWVLTLDDGNDNVFATQRIEYSDFPMPEVMLYVARSDEYWVIMVPSEY